MIGAGDLFSRAQPSRRWLRIVSFPLVRIPIALAFLLPVVLLHNAVFRLARDTLDQSSFDWFQDVQWIADIILFVIAYRLYTRIIEKRPLVEFSTSGAVSETSVGIAIGAVPVCLVVGVMYLAGSYTVEGFGDWTSFVHLLRRFGFGAFLEELVFRVILFRLLEEWLGSLWAVVIATTVFSVAHLGSPGATAWTTLLFSAHGLLMTGCFMLTRRIWMVWGEHFGWNYLQTAVFGMANSGRSDHITFITPRIAGPDWLTGGPYGIEASWLASALILGAGVTVMRMAVRRGLVVRPRWRR